MPPIATTVDAKAKIKLVGLYCLQTSNFDLNPTGKQPVSRRLEGGDRKAVHPDDAVRMLKIKRDLKGKQEPCFTDDKVVFDQWVKEGRIVIDPLPVAQSDDDTSEKGGFIAAMKEAGLFIGNK